MNRRQIKQPPGHELLILTPTLAEYDAIEALRPDERNDPAALRRIVGDEQVDDLLRGGWKRGKGLVLKVPEERKKEVP